MAKKSANCIVNYNISTKHGEQQQQQQQHQIQYARITDLLNYLQHNTASKDDIDDIKSRIDNLKTETNTKIEAVDQKVITMSAQSNEQANKIESLQISVELLKQEQLKNNVCISAVPPCIDKWR